MVEGKLLFPLNVLADHMELVMVLECDHFLLYIEMIFGFLEIVVQIVDQRFQIAGQFRQVIKSLVGAGLVMQDGQDQRPIDGFATSCGILENSFALAEINQCLLVGFVEDFGYSLVVEFSDVVLKSVCINKNVQRSFAQSLSSAFVSMIFLRR